MYAIPVEVCAKIHQTLTVEIINIDIAITFGSCLSLARYTYLERS